MTEAKTLLTIGQVADEVGISTHALRFYEREGLLVTPPQRSSTGHRLYSDNAVEWLRVCIRLRESGMPLPQIKRYVELVRQGAGNEAERLELLRQHRDRVRDQMNELAKSLELIDFKVTVYAAHVADGTAHSLWTGEARDDE